ncbi:MAG: hypothetical protein NTY97_01745 [Planctomycetota bacterium]|nr:hypothetical protein [Planctomycetota bacterium]
MPKSQIVHDAARNAKSARPFVGTTEKSTASFQLFNIDGNHDGGGGTLAMPSRASDAIPSHAVVMRGDAMVCGNA